MVLYPIPPEASLSSGCGGKSLSSQWRLGSRTAGYAGRPVWLLAQPCTAAGVSVQQGLCRAAALLTQPLLVPVPPQASTACPRRDQSAHGTPCFLASAQCPPQATAGPPGASRSLDGLQREPECVDSPVLVQKGWKLSPGLSLSVATHLNPLSVLSAFSLPIKLPMTPHIFRLESEGFLGLYTGPSMAWTLPTSLVSVPTSLPSLAPLQSYWPLNVSHTKLICTPGHLHLLSFCLMLFPKILSPGPSGQHQGHQLRGPPWHHV